MTPVVSSARQPVQCVLAIIGKDRLLRDEALAEAFRAMGDDQAREGASWVNGADKDILPADVLDDLRTPSLLGDRRVVVVESADKFISAHRASLERYCAHPVETGTLVLLCDSFPKNQRLYKTIAAMGGAIACEPPGRGQVEAWIVQRAKHNHGKGLAHETARLLRGYVGDAPVLLDSELGKLACFVGGRARIESADIEALVGHNREEKVFAIVDAVLEGDAAGALRQWAQVLATDRAAEGRAIGGLAYGVRRWIEARRAVDLGASVHSVARGLFSDPSTVQRRFKRVSLREMERQHRGLLDADLAAKNSSATVAGAIERFIVTHAHAG